MRRSQRRTISGRGQLGVEREFLLVDHRLVTHRDGLSLACRVDVLGLVQPALRPVQHESHVGDRVALDGKVAWRHRKQVRDSHLDRARELASARRAK